MLALTMYGDLTGEDGIGKTSLLGAIERHRQADGFVVVRARAFPGDLRSRAGILLDLAGDLIQVNQPALRKLGADLLARLRARPAGTDDVPSWRRKLARDLTEMLAAVGRDLAATPHRQAARVVPLRQVAGPASSGMEAGAGRWHPLTAREFEVAQLVAAGLTNRQIAERLVLAPKTISAHIAHMLDKLHAGRRTEIAAWYAAFQRDPERS